MVRMETTQLHGGRDVGYVFQNPDQIFLETIRKIQFDPTNRHAGGKNQRTDGLYIRLCLLKDKLVTSIDLDD